METEVTTNSLLGKIKEDLSDKTEPFVIDIEKVEEKTEMLKVILEKEKEAEDNMEYITAKYYLDQYYFHIKNIDDISLNDYFKQCVENLVNNNIHNLSREQREKKVNYIIDQQENVKKLIQIMEILGFSDRRQISVNIKGSNMNRIILLQMIFVDEKNRAIGITVENEDDKSLNMVFGVLDEDNKFGEHGYLFFGEDNMVGDNFTGLDGVEHLLDIDTREEIQDELSRIDEHINNDNK